MLFLETNRESGALGKYWYEAHGIGRRDTKIKAYLDES
jgi:hypothetical protein